VGGGGGTNVHKTGSRGYVYKFTRFCYSYVLCLLCMQFFFARVSLQVYKILLILRPLSVMHAVLLCKGKFTSLRDSTLTSSICYACSSSMQGYVYKFTRFYSVTHKSSVCYSCSFSDAAISTYQKGSFHNVRSLSVLCH
jgi:hypothetical protein